MNVITDDLIITQNMKRAAYKAIGSLVFVLAILLIWDKIFVTIKAGEAGVFFDRLKGTEVDKVYKEGFYVIAPWDIMNRYNIRVQEVKHDFDVLSKQGLNITIKTSIRYKPDVNMLGVLHQKVGPDYEVNVIIPQIESIIRKYFGQFTDEELYTSKKAVMNKIFNEAKDELASKYIVLDDLIIRNITFPPSVQEAIEKKVTQFHLFKEYEYKIKKERLEAKRKEIEAKGISKYKSIISKDISPSYLKWKGIEATLDLARSNNSKVVVIGGGKNGMPIILNTDENGKK
jgi:regulator of protease activity HflC (stomatin/prohibitin superfamily)